MKRIAKILAVACTLSVGALFAMPEIAAAQADNVTITKHNLSVSGGGVDPTAAPLEDYGEICVYCHTPHGGQIEAPLWNRAFGAGPYDMYTSATMDMVRDGTPTGISTACLSCHDGTIGLDVIINAPNAFAGAIPPTTVGVNTMPVGNTNLGTDLRNDHPISVVYDEGVDAAFNPKATVFAAGNPLRLFTDPTSPGDKVQCATCHNPHDNTTAQPFLRMSNAASALCKTCHIK